MAEDKFILMGLDDERSKDIADVLSNKTCKKIIDYLADTKEASEKDISEALQIPLNTIEYNLNKLKKAGLVEKTKNFFWSRKGRRIEMYKLAKKHIVISPKPKRVDMKELKTILPIILIAAVLIVLVGFFISKPETIKTGDINLKQFNSIEELKSFLNSGANNTGRDQYSESVNAPSATKSSVTAGSDSGGAASYSQTNIQVAGVDEADIVKNDGKYIYTLSGNKVVIVNAYPASDMKVLSEIKLASARDMFVNGNKLIVFGQSYEYIGYETGVRCLGGWRCGGYSESKSMVYIYDISNREKPVLERNISFDGNYVDSRMINDYVYLISSKYIYRDSPVIPAYEVNGVKTEIGLSNVYYSPYVENSYVFTSINAINVGRDEVNSKVYLTGSTGEVYVSQDNIYLTYQKTFDWQDYNDRRIKEVYLAVAPYDLKAKIQEIVDSNLIYYEKENKIYNLVYEYSMSLKGQEKEDFDKRLQDSLKDFESRIEKERDKTVVHKINVNEDKIEYMGAGEFPGHLLNQFSMDEYNGKFRVATTTGEVWGGNSLNHVYILDEDLKIIGKLEDLAKGEKIYSVRFIGNRGYVVTFKKVDPLFVIDLTNANNPKVLGYLKIPGYSDYLHPYDENHIIGIGKEAVDASAEEVAGRNLDFAWYQGVKISLFDVSDVENPREMGKFVIGDRGTDSPVLWDHKALLFDKEKKLLVIPVTLAEINRSKYRECDASELNSAGSYGYCLSPTTYGEFVWQGAYALNIDLENGISLRGKVSHFDSENVSDRYFYNYQYQIQRSLYMDDVLYTVSQSKIKANELTDLNEISKVDLGYSERDYPIYY